MEHEDGNTDESSCYYLNRVHSYSTVLNFIMYFIVTYTRIYAAKVQTYLFPNNKTVMASNEGSSDSYPCRVLSISC